MSEGWISEDRVALATERLLDAAGEVFARNGVQATTMAEVATEAGCSRATLYNHFGDRRALEVAFVHRQALALSAEIGRAAAGIADPARRAVKAFSQALAAVRSDPRMAAWFSASDVGVATAISADSEVLEALSSAFAGNLVADLDDDDIARRGRWVIRLMVSLLSMPESDPREERRLIEEFFVPSLLSPPRTTRWVAS